MKDELERLRDENRLFREVLETLSEGIAVVDSEGRFLYVNRKAEEYLGYKLVDTLPDHWSQRFQLYLPDGQPFPPGRLPLRRALEGQRVERFEQMLVKNETYPEGVFLGVRATPLEGRKAVATYRSYEPKTLTEELRRLADLTLAFQDAVIGVDLGGVVLHWNVQAESLYGISEHQARGHRLGELWEDGAGQVEEALVQVRRRNRSAHLEMVHQTGTGTAFDVSVDLYPVLDPAERLTSISVVVRDITATKRAEARWRSLLENLPGMVYELDRDLTITFLNRAVPGLTPEQAVGTSMYDYLSPEFHPSARELCQDVFQNGVRRSMEFTAPSLEGEQVRWYWARVGPIVRNGHIDSLIVFTREITRRKQAEQALTESQARLRSLSARIQQAQEEERLRLARELHDELGQMLTAVRLEITMLESRAQASLQSQLKNLSETVGSTLDAVRRIATQLRPQMLDDLGPAAAIDWLAQELCHRGRIAYRVTVELGEARLTKEIDLALFRICQEALTNVVRHAQASEVTISLTATEESVSLVVCDDGRGLNPTTTESSLGLLGMSERALLLGGFVTIEPRPEGGTRVETQIPLRPR